MSTDLEDNWQDGLQVGLGRQMPWSLVSARASSRMRTKLLQTGMQVDGSGGAQAVFFLYGK